MLIPVDTPPDGRSLRGWRSRIRAAVGGDRLLSHYQPIVDLSRAAVVGYEALSRFGDARWTNPEAWFWAARACGLAGELEAAALEAAFSHRPDLPPGCFLTVNVGPDALASPEVRAAFERQGDLGGVVIELTEHTPMDSLLLLPSLEAYREAGALIAVDDLGSGYAGLQHLVNLRPSFIKLDKQFVHGIEADEAKRALVEMLGTFAGRIDCWLVAEGIEQPAELEVLCELGVPLGQGYLLGRPALPWAELTGESRSLLLANQRFAAPGTVEALLRPSPAVAAPEELERTLAEHPMAEALVVLDERHRPLQVVLPSPSGTRCSSRAVEVSPDTSVADAARRAMVRPAQSRFHPLVCTDASGGYLGTVLVERLLERLASDSGATPT